MMEERLMRLCDEVDQLLAQVLADWSNSMVETYRPAGFPFDRLASDLQAARNALYRGLKVVERGDRPQHGCDEEDEESETVRRTIKIDVDEEEVSKPRLGPKGKR
jgi:hypothetical protein